jgi:hypothetical protein
MSQFEIYNKIRKETEFLPLNNNIYLKLPIIEELNSYPQCNLKTELKSKNELFITSKRGRKNKNIEKSVEKINKAIISSKNKVEHNKFCNDNVRRRIKALYNKYIITFLNNLMKTKFEHNKLHFVKMNIRITKDIGIEYNRNLLNKTIKEIISSVSKKYQNSENNKNCIRFIEEQNHNEDILNILNMTYKDLYTDYYLKSTKENTLENSFEAHKEFILSTDGKLYLEIFIKNAENFVEFYIKSKNRKSRKIEEIDTINIPYENEKVETTDSSHIVNNHELVEQVMKTNTVTMVSESTQTDICDINSKLIAFL